MGMRFLFSVGLVVTTVAISVVLRTLASKVSAGRDSDKTRFWIEQAVSLAALVTIVVGLLVLWFDDPARLTGALGLATAGVAVALQRVITSFAGYLIILRGNVFTVGDRITMGSVRGDVIALGFMQTTVMEMGQSPPEISAAPATWVQGRQYSGRIVRITNDRIFDSPVYNYTRDFPYVWEEIRVPIHHGADRSTAEKLLLDIARRHTGSIVEEARPALRKLQRMFFLPDEIGIEPRVYFNVTDNYLELSLRFLSREPGVRDLKDAIFRDILNGFETSHLSIASTSSEITVVNPVRVEGAALS
jgi:small-conductance mechanosensitive channel